MTRFCQLLNIRSSLAVNSPGKSFNRYLILAVSWGLIILLLTMTPGKAIPDYTFLSYDKLGHAFFFGVLVLLLAPGLKTQEKYQSLKRHAVAAAFLLANLYGFIIEYLQSFIPDRSMDYFDALANSTGTVFGIAAFFLCNKLGLL